MRINLTPILILSVVFLACGGTGDNFGDAGEGGGSGGFGGSPGMDGASYDDVFQSGDTVGPIDGSTGGGDTSTGSCSSTCTSDSFCQSACGTTSTYCCDIPTGACYPVSSSTCPVSVSDG